MVAVRELAHGVRVPVVTQHTPFDEAVAQGFLKPGDVGVIGGAVIPPSTNGVNINPHDLSQTTVIVDPDKSDSFVLQLGSLTPEYMARAAASAYATPDSPDVTPEQAIGSAALRMAAAHQANLPNREPAPPLRKVASVPRAPVFDPNGFGGEAAPQPIGVPVPGRPVQPIPVQAAPVVAIPAQVTPVTAQPPRSLLGAFAPQPPAPVMPTQPVAAQRPTQTVDFEIDRYGSLQATYHDVLIGDGFIVLVYDLANPLGSKYYPPSGENAPKMAMQIVGSSTAYLVHTTGIIYPYGQHEFCILMVENEMPTEG